MDISWGIHDRPTLSGRMISGDQEDRNYAIPIRGLTNATERKKSNTLKFLMPPQGVERTKGR